MQTINTMAQTRFVRGVATKVTHTQISHGEVTVVRYHDTDVVAFGRNTIILDSGGWKTNTTKLRMNQASNEYHLGYQVFQLLGKWYVAYRGKTIDFYDNMELRRNA